MLISWYALQTVHDKIELLSAHGRLWNWAIIKTRPFLGHFVRPSELVFSTHAPSFGREFIPMNTI